MQVQLADALKDTVEGAEARHILGKCVHCGFCTAVCPTYKLLGNELDGPRGRIYLIKSVVEGAAVSEATREHLDRCLSCRACEPACPSGVEYGRLADLGRQLVEQRTRRPWTARIARGLLREVLPRARLFSLLAVLGRVGRPLLPKFIGAQIADRRASVRLPRTEHVRKVLMLRGCVQPGLAPNINAATSRVLDAISIQVVMPKDAGCCGAIRQHLGDADGALADARRNIDAWWPAIERGAEAIVMNASGCGAMVREYGYLLRNDPRYAAKAQRVATLTRDIAEVVGPQAERLRARMRPEDGRRRVFHPPCTLQYAQRLSGSVERLLRELGCELAVFAESQMCCGSAGTFALLQAKIARELRDRKLAAIGVAQPVEILSANIGCIGHLRSASPVPVRHWIEWVAERLI